MSVNANPDGCCGASGQCPPMPGPAALQCEIPSLGCSVSVPRTSSNIWGLAGGCSLCGNALGIAISCSGDGNWAVDIDPLEPSCAAATTKSAVASSNPIHVDFEVTLPGTCCQTGTLKGTVTE